jgi:hypothetical protein
MAIFDKKPAILVALMVAMFGAASAVPSSQDDSAVTIFAKLSATSPAVECDPDCSESDPCCASDSCPSDYPVATSVSGSCCFMWTGDCHKCCKPAPPPPPPTPSCSKSWSPGAIPRLQGAGTTLANTRYLLTGTQNDHPHYTNEIDSAYQIYFGSTNRWTLYGPGDRDYYQATGNGGDVPPNSWETQGCVGGCVGSFPAPTLTWCIATPIKPAASCTTGSACAGAGCSALQNGEKVCCIGYPNCAIETRVVNGHSECWCGN